MDQRGRLFPETSHHVMQPDCLGGGRISERQIKINGQDKNQLRAISKSQGKERSGNERTRLSKSKLHCSHRSQQGKAEGNSPRAAKSQITIWPSSKTRE